MAIKHEYVGIKPRIYAHRLGGELYWIVSNSSRSVMAGSVIEAWNFFRNGAPKSKPIHEQIRNYLLQVRAKESLERVK